MFTTQERLVYQCPANRLFYDPLAVKRTIATECKGQYGALVAEARAGDLAAQGALIKATRTAFALPSIDPSTGAGVVDARAYEALIDFTRWLQGKEPRVPTPPNSAPSTESPTAVSATKTTSA